MRCCRAMPDPGSWHSWGDLGSLDSLPACSEALSKQARASVSPAGCSLPGNAELLGERL